MPLAWRCALRAVSQLAVALVPAAEGRQQFIARGRLDRVLGHRTGGRNRQLDLRNVRRATAARRNVLFEERVVLLGQRAIEVLGYEFHEFLASYVFAYDSTHDSSTP